MNVVAEMMRGELHVPGRDEPRRYLAALEGAFAVAPPVYGFAAYGDRFRRASSDPVWVASSLVTNAEREADGSTRLWSLAASSADAEIAGAVKRHAIDEARHSRWYIAALDLVFPGAVDADLRRHVDRLSPRYDAHMTPRAVPGSPFAHEVTLDDLIQMNLAEIRTWVNQQLQRPILLAYCAPQHRHKLRNLLDRLLIDEVAHVGYSARLIERWATDDPDEPEQIMTRRGGQLNEITADEVDRDEFALHCSNPLCALAPTCRPGADAPDGHRGG